MKIDYVEIINNLQKKREARNAPRIVEVDESAQKEVEEVELVIGKTGPR
jgi:hypothetical protein